MQTAGNIILAGPDGSFGCGSKLRGTGFKSRLGRMCVIEVVHTVLKTVQRPGVRSVVYRKP